MGDRLIWKESWSTAFPTLPPFRKQQYIVGDTHGHKKIDRNLLSARFVIAGVRSLLSSLVQVRPNRLRMVSIYCYIPKMDKYLFTPLAQSFIWYPILLCNFYLHQRSDIRSLCNVGWWIVNNNTINVRETKLQPNLEDKPVCQHNNNLFFLSDPYHVFNLSFNYLLVYYQASTKCSVYGTALHHTKILQTFVLFMGQVRLGKYIIWRCTKGAELDYYTPKYTHACIFVNITHIQLCKAFQSSSVWARHPPWAPRLRWGQAFSR